MYYSSNHWEEEVRRSHSMTSPSERRSFNQGLTIHYPGLCLTESIVVYCTILCCMLVCFPITVTFPLAQHTRVGTHILTPHSTETTYSLENAIINWPLSIIFLDFLFSSVRRYILILVKMLYCNFTVTSLEKMFTSFLLKHLRMINSDKCIFVTLLQLYEINNDPKRKEFLDDLFSFMQKRGEYKFFYGYLFEQGMLYWNGNLFPVMKIFQIISEGL